MKNRIYLGFLFCVTPALQTIDVTVPDPWAIAEKLKPSIDSTRTLEFTVNAIRASYSTVSSKAFEAGQKQYHIASSIPTKLQTKMRETVKNYNETSEDVPDHSHIKAPVFETTDLSDNEQAFTKARLQHIASAFKDFELTIDPKNLDSVPRIAVCASGGGFRAMVATMGFWEGMNQIKSTSEKYSLRDLIVMTSCLSGSTWFTSPWCIGKEISQLKASYKKYALIPLSKKLYDVKNNPLALPQYSATKDCLFAEMPTITNKFYQNFYWTFPYNLVQLYGNLVGHMTLAAFDDPDALGNFVSVNQMVLDEYLSEAQADDYTNLEYTGPYAMQSRQTVYFSQAADFLMNNPEKRPLPLATSVTRLEGSWWDTKSTVNKKQQSFDGYTWLTYTPFDVALDYHDRNGKQSGARIETKYLGRKFDNLRKGPSRSHRLINRTTVGYGAVNAAPEYSLSYLQGIWGSAFGISVDFILNGNGLEDAIDPENIDTSKKSNTTEKSALQHIKQALAWTLKTSLTTLTRFGDFRLFPAVINNFAVHPDSPFSNYDTLITVDAGIAFNLPFPPLMHKDRKIDMIIALDASADVSEGSLGALVGAERWAKAKGIPFPKVSTSSKYANATTRPHTVFDEFENGQTGPIIFYIPLIDNTFLCKGSDEEPFSLTKCLKAACNTFNFDYQPDDDESPHHIDELSNHVACAVRNLQPHLMNQITKLVKEKNTVTAAA